MCNLNIFGLYEVREETYILLIAHLYAFLFGYLVCKQRTKFKATKVILDISYLIKNILFWIIYLSCLYFVYKLVVSQANMFALYSLSEIRQDFEELVLEGSGLLFYQVFAIGMFHFCNCLFIYLLFFDKSNRFFFPLFLVYSVLYALAGGGRNQFATFVYYLINYYILKDFILSSLKGKKTIFVISAKIKIASIIFVIISFVGMSFFSALRSDTNSEINLESATGGLSLLSEAFVNYSIGPIVAFDRGISMKRFNDTQHLGLASFDGSENLLYHLVIKHIYSGYRRTSKEVTSWIQQNRIYIGPGKTWNYAYTSCFYYFCDFNIAGVLIMPFVLGFLFKQSISIIENKLTIFSIALFLYIGFCFYNSVFTFYLHKTGSLIYVFILLLLNSYIGEKGNIRCHNKG